MNCEIYKLCPNCYNNKAELNILGYEQCTKCGYVFGLTGHVHSDSSTSTSSIAANCPYCNEKMDYNQQETKWSCSKCGYTSQITTGDPPTTVNDLYIKSDGVGTAWGRLDPDLMPLTLQIDTELIKLKHKEMELEFELEPDKLANIDTIVINGYKYVKEK